MKQWIVHNDMSDTGAWNTEEIEWKTMTYQVNLLSRSESIGDWLYIESRMQRFDNEVQRALP